MANYGHKKSRVIEHTIFKSTLEVNSYYKNHPLTNALGKEWGIIRVEYSGPQYDGFYIFTAIADRSKCEIDMPRAVIAIRNCTEADRESIDDIFVEPQPDGPESIRFQTHVMCATYKEVKEYFKHSSENIPEIEMKVLRAEFRGVLPHSDYKDCYTFFAIDMSTGIEMEIPRALLPKSNCTKKDNKEIAKLDVYVDESDEEDISIGPESEDYDSDETEDVPVVTQDKPDPKKSIN